MLQNKEYKLPPNLQTIRVPQLNKYQQGSIFHINIKNWDCDYALRWLQFS